MKSSTDDESQASSWVLKDRLGLRARTPPKRCVYKHVCVRTHTVYRYWPGVQDMSAKRLNLNF